MTTRRSFFPLAAAVAVMLLTMLGTGSAVRAEEPYKQIKLTEQMIKSFIAAQKAIADYAQKNPPTASDKPDPKVQAELDAISKKHGFASFADFDDVAYNISIVMGGLDPQTGVFTDPLAALKKEIDDVTADKSIPEAEKKKMLDELREAMKQTPALKFPENVELVKQHRAELEKVLQ